MKRQDWKKMAGDIEEMKKDPRFFKEIDDFIRKTTSF